MLEPHRSGKKRKRVTKKSIEQRIQAEALLRKARSYPKDATHPKLELTKVLPGIKIVTPRVDCDGSHQPSCYELLLELPNDVTS